VSSSARKAKENQDQELSKDVQPKEELKEEVAPVADSSDKRGNKNG